MFHDRPDSPDLLTHLERKYREHSEQPVGMTCDADKFFAWAREYMTTNRPGDLSVAYGNFGFSLTDGSRMNLCPSAASSDPQPDVPQYYPITSGR